MAARFWVSGGTGNWSSTTNWSASSGGSSGATVPGASDQVNFFASSGAGTATVDSSVTIQRLTMTGFTGTLAFGSNTISLNSTGTIFTGAATYTVTGTPLILCTNSGSTSRTINAGTPTEANSISFNFTAGTGSTAITTGTRIRSLIYSDTFTGSLTNTTRTIFGDLTLRSAMTVSGGNNTTTFAATSGIQKITSADRILDFPITLAGTATYQLQDNLNVGNPNARTLTLTSGTLDLNGQDVLLWGTFSSSNTNVRAIVQGSINGGILMRGRSMTWNCADLTNFTVTGNPVVNAGSDFTSDAITISHGTTAGGTEARAMSFFFGTGSLTLTVSQSRNWIRDLGCGSGGANPLVVGAPVFLDNISGDFNGNNVFGYLLLNASSGVKNVRCGFTSGSNPSSVNNYAMILGGSASYQLAGDSTFKSLYVQRPFSQNGYEITTQYMQISGPTAAGSVTLNSTINIAHDIGNTAGLVSYSAAGVVNTSGLVVNGTGTAGANFPRTTYIGNFTIPTLNSNTPFVLLGTIAANSFTNSYVGASIKIYQDSIFTVNNLDLNVTSTLTYEGVEDANSNPIIRKTSGTVFVSNQTISHIIADGGAVFRAPTNAPYSNVNGGNNVGWDFSPYLTTNSGNFFLMF